MPAHVVIYTRSGCSYCTEAKQLLESKDVRFREIELNSKGIRYFWMVSKTNFTKRTFPEIFINGKHIGGCDDLVALDQAGKLSALLAAKPPFYRPYMIARSFVRHLAK